VRPAERRRPRRAGGRDASRTAGEASPPPQAALENLYKVDSATCSIVVVALYNAASQNHYRRLPQRHIQRRSLVLSQPFLDHTLMGSDFRRRPILDGCCKEYPWPKTETTHEQKIKKTSVCARQIQWPGAGSNRRPSDFQDYGAVSVSDRHRPRPAPERPRDRWRTPVNERE
jgi:hypothetical protein